MGALLWAQPYFSVEGGALLAHRIPIVPGQPWQGVGNRGGEQRVPGPGFWLGVAAGYNRTPIHNFRLALGLQSFGVQAANRTEQFGYALAPLTTLWRLRPSENPWYLGMRFGAAILLSATSKPNVATVYRFRDYFSRSTLRAGPVLEKVLAPRLRLTTYLDLDLISAWDKGLFRSYNALAYHLFLGAGLFYQVWSL